VLNANRRSLPQAGFRSIRSPHKSETPAQNSRVSHLCRLSFTLTIHANANHQTTPSNFLTANDVMERSPVCAISPGIDEKFQNLFRLFITLFVLREFPKTSFSWIVKCADPVTNADVTEVRHRSR
jgi:hypothetical protein